MSYYTLLTGATGLVGCFLMRDLLAGNKRLAVLVRPTEQQSVAERAESMLARWESFRQQPMARPVYLEGDINRSHLGLTSGNRRWIARHCQRVVHNAAVLKFVGDDRRKDPWRTNVGGTRRTLELCQEVGLREFHYVSTAYVCGKREGEAFVLEGGPLHVVGAGRCGVFLVPALTGPTPGPESLSFFLVPADASGVTLGEPASLLGTRGADVRPLSLEGVRVEASALLGGEGRGAEVLEATLAGARLALATIALGLAQGALDKSLPYAKEREAFDQPLHDFEGRTRLRGSNRTRRGEQSQEDRDVRSRQPHHATR
jgi:hypothetical protein